MIVRLLAGAVALGVAATPAAQQVFRGGTDTVFLSITVLNAAGQFVPGLSRDQFEVYEDGVRQDILTFSSTQQPIALSLLIDTSTSMEVKLPIAQQAAIGFVRRLGEQDLAQIVDFDNQFVILQDFTGDTARLEGAIERTQAGGSTSLYNALYTTLREPTPSLRARSTAEIRRRAIVVLSDGEDTSSVIGYDLVLDGAKRSEIAVYAIGLRSRTDSPRRGFNEADFVLRTISQETGGKLFFVNDVAELPAVYQQIAEELANQYTIGYTSKNPRRDGSWRRLHVRVTRPETTARTRLGYFGPKDRS